MAVCPGASVPAMQNLPRVTVVSRLARVAQRTIRNAVGRQLASARRVELSNREFLQAARARYDTMPALLSAFRSGHRPAGMLRGDREELVLLLRQRPDWVERVTTDAEKARSGTFDLLGSGEICVVRRPPGSATVLPPPLDWHLDFKSGQRWDPHLFHADVLGQNRPGADIKVPWELARFHHLSVLGQAYWLTADERYADTFVCQVTDWIACNPPGYGVNWASAMEVAIRAINWVIGYQFFRDAAAVTDDFLARFVKSLFLHGRHIRRNLERVGPFAANHYLANLVGLLCLGVVFHEFPEAQAWRDFSVAELVREIDRQVLDDGLNFEASTSYHRLATELLFFAAWLCRANAIELPGQFWHRLRAMFTAVLHYLKPNSRAPQIGDNDSGRLFTFESRSVLDHRYLLDLGALLFDDGELKLATACDPEVLWFFGAEGVTRHARLPARQKPLPSRPFPQGGLYLMRHDDCYLILSCGPNGQHGVGGHAHNDKLSFELHARGADIVVDPGTYVYTPSAEWRDRMRSTASHNTVVIEGQEQNPIDPRRPFLLRDLAQARCLRWQSEADEDLFIGEHYGYTRLPAPVVHQREVRFQKRARRWMITDRILPARARAASTSPRHAVEWFLHLAPGVQAQWRNGRRLGLWRGHRYLAEVCLPGRESVELKSGWFSPEYGIKVPSVVLHWSHRVPAPFEYEWGIRLVGDGEAGA